MTDIRILAIRIKEGSKGQKTPVPVSEEDWLTYAVDGYRQLYIDTGLESWDQDFSDTIDEEGNRKYTLDRDFSLRETRYAYLSGRIFFLDNIASTVNNIASYSTDALSVTGVKDMWSHINGDRNNLIQERTNLFYQVISSSNNI